MPRRKRIQREHTEDWQTIQQYTVWPEQTAYELLRAKYVLELCRPYYLVVWDVVAHGMRNEMVRRISGRK